MSNNGEQLNFSFGENFMMHHAGRIITDQRYAIVELVANCWDAGADRVDVTWPLDGGKLIVQDNGTGMSKSEFTTRWTQLNYNRIFEQGLTVVFPKGTRTRARSAFGRNGIGRHAMFAFAPIYTVETRKGSKLTRATVARSSGESPYQVQVIGDEVCQDNGTTLTAHVSEIILAESMVIDLIGSRFVADPEFRVFVNAREVSMMDLEHRFDTATVQVDGLDPVIVHRFDAEADRTTHQHGVAWWVNHRLVGNPSWEGIEGKLLDGRGTIAKRYTYVVEADGLVGDVKHDWSGFHGESARKFV
ncbi:MAG: ATP-binding protein [Bacteroidota bacterium]